MIDIQEAALRALEQNALVGIREVLEDLRDIDRNRRNDLRILHGLIQGLREVDRFGAEVIFQQEVMVIENLAQLRCKILANKQV